jgi:hypothetical protein
MALTIRIPRRGKRVSVSLRPECPLVAEVFLAVLPVAVLPVAVSQAVHPVELREEASRVELPAVDLRGAFDNQSPRSVSSQNNESLRRLRRQPAEALAVPF